MSKQRKILLVEDNKDIAKVVRYNLQKEGYLVFWAESAETGMPVAHKRKPDLILLDIMLPGKDGIEFFRDLRQNSKTPVIFLTAKKGEVDRIVGLRMGADDYLTKPFSIGELIARIEAVLRRFDHDRSRSDGDGALQIGALRLDPLRHEVRVKGKPLSLTPKEFHLLHTLMEDRGKVISRDDLLERVWGHDKSCDIDTRTIDQHISRLRIKLGPEKDRIITVAHCGYRIETA